MVPLRNSAMSVVPPPMSTSATPSSRSSGESTASLEAIGSSTMSITLRPARLQHFTTFWAEVTAAVTMWMLAISRTPDMPIGCLIPS